MPAGCSVNLAELPTWARELFERSRVARLGLTDDAGAPRVLPVTYAVNGTRLISAVDHKPKRVSEEELARVRWLRARPRAALTVDHYDEDWSKLAWVQALGEIRVVHADNEPEAVLSLTERYEAYRACPPSSLLLSLEPQRLLWWLASATQPWFPK
jgi:PPOX class probable F420-dependent enzyme